MSRFDCYHISGPLVGRKPNLKRWGDQWRCSPFIAWPRIFIVSVSFWKIRPARKLEYNFHLNKKWWTDSSSSRHMQVGEYVWPILYLDDPRLHWPVNSEPTLPVSCASIFRRTGSLKRKSLSRRCTKPSTSLNFVMRNVWSRQHKEVVYQICDLLV